MQIFRINFFFIVLCSNFGWIAQKSSLNSIFARTGEEVKEMLLCNKLLDTIADFAYKFWRKFLPYVYIFSFNNLFRLLAAGKQEVDSQISYQNHHHPHASGIKVVKWVQVLPFMIVSKYFCLEYHKHVYEMHKCVVSIQWKAISFHFIWFQYVLFNWNYWLVLINMVIFLWNPFIDDFFVVVLPPRIEKWSWHGRWFKNVRAPFYHLQKFNANTWMRSARKSVWHGNRIASIMQTRKTQANRWRRTEKARTHNDRHSEQYWIQLLRWWSYRMAHTIEDCCQTKTKKNIKCVCKIEEKKSKKNYEIRCF